MNKSSWIPEKNINYINLKTNSWFDILKTSRKINKDYNKIVCTPDVLRCEKIRIYPTDKQRDILHKWFNLHRKMYNVTTKFLENKLWKNDVFVKKNISKYVNFRILRTKYLKSDKEKLCKHKVNKHLLDQAISRCVAMYKSAITNYKKKNIKNFRIRPLKKNKRYKNLIIEGCLFSKTKNSFCTSIIGEINSEKPFNNTKKTCILSYDKYKSTYTLNIPRDSGKGTFTTRKLVCGIDPGVRTFLTVYSKKDCYQICNNPNFKKYYKRMDRLNEIFTSEESCQTRKYKKSIGKMFDKINNKVKDMHFKVAKYLCSRFQILKLGNISTNKIVSKETGNIGKSTRRLLYSLSHFRFREILTHQAEKYGCKLKIVSEYLTTKTCSNCGNKKDVGKSKVYECNKCELYVDRDINAAKNIRYV
ncbi:putative transposase [Megavirus courdo11]|uniref:Putative transposase n=1 Tax=Megavirus courdo11 TaxID=1128140 RepID=K7YXM8_9VIRU|nr:putative transposase [Megavirus courdo11]